MDLGVRFATENSVLADQFRRALDMWATILDLDWHEDNTRSCAIQLMDGQRDLFPIRAIAARAQFPDRLDFQGWIAFNPGLKLSEDELYEISLHEIGHIFGLLHSSNAASVMYGFDLDGPRSLDQADMAALAARHKLRIATPAKLVELTQATAVGSPKTGYFLGFHEPRTAH
jgi:hypothetical protein